MSAPSHRVDVGEWRPIRGYEGRYEISSSGSVRSLSSYRPSSGGILKPWTQNRGYQYVSFRSAEGKRDSFAVHRLVLDAFVGPCPPGKQVAHYDGDPTNNSLSNLRWASAKENIADRARHGRTVIGEENGSSKLDRHVVKTIKKLKATGLSAYEVARLASVHTTTIQRIWSGEAWTAV